MNNRHILNILLLMAALFAVTGSHAQTRPDSRSFDHLWTLYDGIPQRHRTSQHAMLDTIVWKAEAEHNAYHLFIANHKRLLLNRLFGDKSVQQSAMWLDSLRRDNAAARWDDRDSMVYQSLYHYLIGLMLYPSRPADPDATTLQEADFRNMAEWSAENYREVAKRHFFACFDAMPRDVPILTHRWDFLLETVPETRHLRPTLNDVLYQSCIRMVGDKEPELAIALIDEAMAAHTERNILIDYEVQRLHYRFPKVDEDVYASACWKTLDSLEKAFGPDLTFDYERGVLLAAAEQIVDWETDYKSRAIDYFNQVLKQCGTEPYADAVLKMYAQNAAYYLETLTLPSISLFDAHTDLTLGHKLRIPIQYRNLETLYVSVYTTSPITTSEYDDDGSSEDHYSSRYKNHNVDTSLLSKVPVLWQRFDLDSRDRSRFSTTELWVDSLPVGNYQFCFHTRPELDVTGALMTAKFRVTRLKLANWNAGKKKFVAVNDRRTGEPLRSLRVKSYYPHALYSNRFGEISYSDNLFGLLYFEGELSVFDQKAEYSVMDELASSAVYRPIRHGHRCQYNPQLFTDRTLYRPGQTVHFKYILSKKGKAVKNKRVLAILERTNAAPDTLELVTSEYGSVSGEFSLPQTVGKYTLRVFCPDQSPKGGKRYMRTCSGRRATIEVAEYKLPTFKVTLEPDSQQVAAGDTLPIRGTVTALNGLPIANAAVALHIQAKGEAKTRLIEVYTECDGRFEYRYPVGPFSYMLEIEAIVTDLNGETHRDESSVWIPDKMLTVSISKDDDVDLSLADTARWLVKAVNHNGILQPVPMNIRVVRLQTPDEYRIPAFERKPLYWHPMHSEAEYAREFPHLTFDPHANNPDSWPGLDTVYKTEETMVPDSILKINVRNWEAGNYLLLVECVDKSGKTASAKRHFTVNRSDDSKFRPFQPIRATFVSVPERLGEPLILSVGSCLRNAVAICDVYQGERKLKTLRIPLDREQRTVTVKTHRGGKRNLSFCARIVKDDQLHKVIRDTLLPLDARYIERVNKRYRKLIMNAKLTHYRDVSEPGSNEHWEITLTDGDSKSVQQAELLAWMIDGSLYELGMRKADYGQHYYPQRFSIPRKIRQALMRPSRNHCYDLSDAYSDYTRYNKGTASKTKLRYEKVQSPMPRYIYYQDNTTSNELSEVVIAWEPPVFSADNTSSSGGFDVASALANLDGVSSVDGTMTSVRGNRSDGPVTIVDGVRTDSAPEIEIVETVTNPILSPDVTPRSNFVETAFFYPNLHPYDSGRVHIDFTLPDQYTGWEFYAIGHTKDMRKSSVTALLQSRRTLMLQSNAPRFFREGDTLTLRAKVTNRSESDLDGEVTVTFFNGENGEPLDILVGNAMNRVATDGKSQFSVTAGASQSVQFRIIVPEGIPAIGYRMVARAGNYGDGEENLLPVLPNRMLVTESCPFVVPAGSDTAVTFRRYRTHSTPTMQPLSYTVEATTNPAWLAIRALPYLMRYPYDCNEQTFSKLFAAATVQHALAQNPGLREVFTQWLSDTVNNALTSPLLKNESLQSMLTEETPWLRDAQIESQQRIETAKLFADENLQKVLDKSFNKLQNNQLLGGGWDWYGRWSYSPYITDHLVAGFYKLQCMGITVPNADKMLDKAICAADRYQEERYQAYLKRLEKDPKAMFYFSEEDIHYLYARTFAPFDSIWLSKPYVQNLTTRMMEDLEKAKFTRQAEVALVLYRIGRVKEAKDIMETIRQQSVIDREKGMYWRREYSGCYYRWYEAPIERQALLIEAFTEISPREDELTMMKQWLLMQKEGNSWSNTKATAEAVYALLLGAPADLLQPATTVVTVGGEEITATEAARAEAGTGYLQRVWKSETMTPALADITVRTDGTHPAFGAAYWQYLEVPDKVEATGSGLSVRRTLYHQPAVGDGKTAAPVTADNPVRLGERITLKIVITSDRDLEYVQVKDPRAAAFEPVNIHEREGNQGGVWWVESPRDAANCFFFSRFPQGTIVLEYDVFATQSGDFSAGATTVECMYAPEYWAQGSGVRVTVR
ncbi:MAG: alpha-2-macroglobulin family protein [Bacteroidales bacterium]|nr:alpha-2-macroglobulin family protein [Bacteroidales bacterium]